MNTQWEVWGSLIELSRGTLQVGAGLALQSTLLLDVGLLAAWLLRRSGPAVTNLIYQATLGVTVAGALFALALAGRVEPLWSVSLPPASTTLIAVGMQDTLLPTPAAPGSPGAGGAARRPAPPGPGAGRTATAGAVDGLPTGTEYGAASLPPHPTTAASSAGASGLGWLYILLVGVWALGTLTLLTRLAHSHRLLHRFRKTGIPAGADAEALLHRLCETRRLAPPLLRVSAEIRSPLLTGFRRPVILLPASYAQDFDSPALRAVLSHELAHLARRDCAWMLSARLLLALGWCQPLLWTLVRRLEESSEQLCDEEVLLQDTDPRAYARCLVDLAERLLPARWERAAGAGMAAHRSALEQRVRHILNRPLRPQVRPTARLRGAVALGAVAVMAAGLTLISAAANTDRSQRADLAAVGALKKPLTYWEIKIPLGELVRKVAADTGVALIAAGDVADEPVAVAVTDLPAHELLQQVADLLDYQWSRRGREGAWRYEIEQDLASKQREEALRRREWAEVEARFQAEVKRQVEAPLLSRAEINRLLDEEEDRGRRRRSFTSPAERDAFFNAPQEIERSRRYSDAHRQSSPIRQALTRFLGRVTPQQWTALRQGEVLRFSTAPRPGELPLPPDLAQTLRKSKPTEYVPGRRIYPDHPEIDAEIRGREKRTQDLWSSANDYRVSIRLGPVMNQYRAWGPSLQVSVGAEPILSDPPAGPEGARSLHYFDLGAHISILARTTVGEQWAAENTPERSAALAKDPVLGTRKLFKPAAKPSPVPGWGPDAIRVWRLDTLLPEVARTYGVNLIADAYWGAPAITLPQIASSSPTPLHALLDRLVQPRYRWERRGAVIHVRSRNWFFDRPREIPLRLVRRWQELVRVHGSLPLEEVLQSLSTLSEEQIESLAPPNEAAYPEELSQLTGLHRARHVLRLYASLSAGQRQSLWRGEPLPVAQMLPAQQALYLNAVRELSRHRAEAPDLERWASGRLVLRGVPQVRVRERTASGTSERVELPTRLDGWESGEATEPSSRRPLVLPLVEAALVARRAAAAAAVTPAGSHGPTPANPTAAAPIRLPCLNLLFRLEHDPSARLFTMVGIAAPAR